MSCSTCVAFWFMMNQWCWGLHSALHFRRTCLSYSPQTYSPEWKKFPRLFGSFLVSRRAKSTAFDGSRVVSSRAPRTLRRISLSRCRTMSLYGLFSRYARLRIFLTWSSIFENMALWLNFFSAPLDRTLPVFAFLNRMQFFAIHLAIRGAFGWLGQCLVSPTHV